MFGIQFDSICHHQMAAQGLVRPVALCFAVVRQQTMRNDGVSLHADGCVIKQNKNVVSPESHAENGRTTEGTHGTACARGRHACTSHVRVRDG